MTSEGSYGPSPLASVYREVYWLAFIRHWQRQFTSRYSMEPGCQPDCFFCRRDAEKGTS